MSEEQWYQKRERLAAEKIEALIALPVPLDDDDLGSEGFFDPWDLFPLYGIYSSDFDEMAIEVLGQINSPMMDQRRDLASEMFREMLCKMDLCEYGTSPRCCFPTQRFKALLLPLIEAWMAYSEVQWGKANV